MVQQKLVYSGAPVHCFAYEYFREFWQKRDDARCVVRDDDSLNDGIVKFQVWHVEPGVSISYDDRVYNCGRHATVMLYGSTEGIKKIEDIIANEASKYGLARRKV